MRSEARFEASGSRGRPTPRSDVQPASPGSERPCRADRRLARRPHRAAPSILDARSSIRFLLPCVPAYAHAATPEVATTGSLLEATLGLALVVALIVAVAWIARRFTPGALRGGMPLTIVASQAVGQRERVVVVEVADQWLVLGVAPGRVSSLATLPRGERPTAPAAGATFASALSRALGRRD